MEELTSKPVKTQSERTQEKHEQKQRNVADVEKTIRE
jgi:hypothetical protein